MNKKLLAVAIAASAFGTQAVAVELYNNDGTTFAMGGHVSVNLNGSEAGDAGVGTNSSRINFTATQELDNGVTVDARGEWGLNFLNGGEQSFTTRLGYIGATHEELGRAVVGTQWAPYYDVAGVTDMPIAFANEFIYDNHGELGTGRGENMVSYRNGVDLAEAGAIDFGFAWQGTQGDYKDRLQATVAYSIAGATLGYAYNGGDIKDSTDSAISHVFAASYGSYGNGLYLAGIYAANENMNELTIGSNSSVTLAESNGYEAIAAYALANSLNFSVNYEMVEGEVFKGASTSTEREEMAFQVEYNFASNIVGYTGYQFDLKSEDGYKSDDKWTIGARFYL
ncbi:porin [uncultured Vibrio sp.]|uniref:porin n=1 Tax=uncultured Vibrio sp. TaxID=114054 RepID=UPI0025D5FD62|nr:porin [uncultured Vibrio sp.]